MTVLKRLALALATSSGVLLGGHAVAADSAFSHFYPVTREAAQSLAGHTVFRPADLDAVTTKMPVVFWANGGCNASNFGFTYILTAMAARGFVVVANGAFDAVLAGGNVTPSKLAEAMNWIQDANKPITGQFRGKLDTSKMAVAGQSCGGLEALVAAADPRIDTVMAFNTGFFPTPTNGYGREQLKNIQGKPVLVVNGGPQDVAYQNSIDNYNLLIAQGTPSYLASNSHAWHSGLWFGIRDGVGDTQMLAQAERLAVNWLDYWLNGNAVAGRYFFGPGCGLCTQPDWTVKTSMDRPDVL